MLLGTVSEEVEVLSPPAEQSTVIKQSFSFSVSDGMVERRCEAQRNVTSTLAP